MKHRIPATLISLIALSALSIAALILTPLSNHVIHASTSGPDVVAFDGDINNTPANQKNSVGTIEPCGLIIGGSGGTVSVDIIVKGVPPSSGGSGGISGFDFAILYDPALLNITAADIQQMLTVNGGSATNFSGQSPPDTSGDFRLDVAGDSSFPFASGDGVLVRLTFKAVAASGTSTIIVTDTSNGPGAAPTIVAANTVPYPPSPVQNGTIVIGSACTVLNGDANCDGKVDPTDALAILGDAGGVTPKAPCQNAEDVDCNGHVDGLDALRVLRWFIGAPMSHLAGCPEVGDPLT